MTLKNYYQGIRDASEMLQGEHVVVVSLATSEGGKPGVRTEAPRAIAAKLIAEQRARVATEDEAREFHEVNRNARIQYEEQQAARRLQVMVIPAQDFKKQRDRS